jgi:hypothetical protein
MALKKTILLLPWGIALPQQRLGMPKMLSTYSLISLETPQISTPSKIYGQK